jgi:GNAT superfamily N-acetyltransferase
MSVIYRALRDHEVSAACSLFVESLTDLVARRGLDVMIPAPSQFAPVYLHIARTGIFQVAELDGSLVAIGHATVREDLWFLSGFWVRPELQGRGIGGPLLDRVFSEGRERGARRFFTWSTPDTAAIASYLRRGLLPGYPILTLGAPRESVDLSSSIQVETAPISADTLERLERGARGARCESDHPFFASEGRGHDVRSRGRALGYFYVSHGVVGPAAWSEPEDADAVVIAALREASSQANDVRVMVPGINHAALRCVLARGLRLRAASHLLMSEPLGRHDRYLPSGPSLF